MFGLRFLPHILAAGALAGGLGYMAYLKNTNRALRASVAVMQAQLEGCHARNENIMEDRASDAEIDHLPDTDLRDRASEWLREGP